MSREKEPSQDMISSKIYYSATIVSVAGYIWSEGNQNDSSSFNGIGIADNL